MRVYDNTRIIIVADHGYSRKGPFSSFPFKENMICGRYNPLLLVKDFDSNSDIVTDSSRMTNADVPFLASKGLVSQQVNPFTGESFFNAKDGTFTAYDFSGRWRGKRIRDPSRSVIIKDGMEVYDLSQNPAFEVSGSIFDVNNWKEIQ